MKHIGSKIRGFFDSRLGFFFLAIALFWAKTYWAYQNKFNLGVKGSMQDLLLALNPIPTTLLLFGIALYMRGRKSYIVMLIIDALTSIWLFANVLYYREFSDFLTFALIKGSGAVSNNLSKGIFGIMRPSDWFVFLDLAILIILLATHLIHMDLRPIKKRFALGVSLLAVLLFGANLSMAYSDRSGLLTRTFDNNYIVKYLGLNAYTVVDGVKTARTSATKANAKASDIDSVLNYLKKNKVAPNVEYSGVAKGKNVFIIHLESFQQFLIDFKWDGQEVTPNLNKLYHESDTLSFDNFFNQVGQGKTADAEMMLENSLFGLPEGSAMVSDGTSNTFQAAPAIMDQNGYTTAAAHGDVPSFWNRDNTYKSWGYDYFFTKNYFQSGKNFDVGYGLKDKIFMKDAAEYVEQLPQPFYAKLITVTNHYPYTLDKQNQTITKTDTGDDTVDGYVQTAKYLDQSIGEFMTWLKQSGLDKNSMVVFYGDHYGISGNHKKAVAKLLGKKSFDDFDNAQFQRVPFMIHMDGLKGGVNHTYGGEIDVLPTLLNLLGIKADNYVQFGSDLLSSQHSQTVAFRNGDFVTPQYTKVGSTYYDTTTGKVIKHLSSEQKATIDKATNQVTTELNLSDRVMNEDLLRFYTPNGFMKVDKSDYSYNKKKALAKLKKAQKKGTSVLAKNKGVAIPYVTDAPELVKAGSSSSSSSLSSSSSSK
ncbi:LTA synthase family protein [Lacticaseibacillus manihotivorans]|uniref:Phosphoglycerol transferase related protein, alkaline phosphatase superfamily n=2 Tax=Lacticaseibacillus manihotivorans TaxID=88233 RepID=A0A0R1Q5M8_9LACO|nr:LTA synthase family protein [Lacticaseibacillus manihotivorans]KRL39869.1 Phosphoglycerol transferase related protein, alkaline phosphatase superfamily [Lacticaseibacillus manihotivorans DSM 13343 = JCM 12514]QFQ92494.1 sulfatase-like hydrolase/transferase [Lacticaseibacillus manihotivorans]